MKCERVGCINFIEVNSALEGHSCWELLGKQGACDIGTLGKGMSLLVIRGEWWISYCEIISYNNGGACRETYSCLKHLINIYIFLCWIV